VRAALAADHKLPEAGQAPDVLLRDAARQLFEHSLFNGHPRFFGYVTSSPAPIGMLAELLASAVNANVGAWKLSPMATEIEGQVFRWLSQFIGYPDDCGGMLLSGGNMANMTCFLAARAAHAGWDVRKQGVEDSHPVVSRHHRPRLSWSQRARGLPQRRCAQLQSLARTLG
jgi:glutamate/tyrosine decarboxylase-like PLP-dependent enzyme